MRGLIVDGSTVVHPGHGTGTKPELHTVLVL